MKRVSYGQTGQDILAHFLLLRHGKIPRDPTYKGSYVDVGACHPVKTSNTYFFYERGWRGLCVEANPDAKAEFDRVRPEDAYAQAAVGESKGVLPFYIFVNPQHNCLDPKRAEAQPEKLVATIEVPVKPLADMIAEAGMTGPIDFLSIDTEGHELVVLRSLDLARHRPKLILLECIKDVFSVPKDPAVSYLMGEGYKLLALTGHDAFLMAR